MSRQAVDAWTRYWAGGEVTSLPQVFGDPLRGPLADFWRGRLAPLGHRARILDLGCGNGTVALLAAAIGMERAAHWEIHGADSAAIDPQRDLTGRYRELAAAVTFHPGTAMAATPFAAGHFDLVAAQYALEYGDPPRVLDEVRRLLRPGASAAFILHLQESEVVASAVVELAQLRASRALFAAAASVLDVSAAAAPARAQLSAWSSFAHELLRLDRLAAAHPKRWPVAILREVPATVRDLLTAAVPEPGSAVGARAAQRCRRLMADFSGLLAAQAERLTALLAAAPDRAALQHLLHCAQRRDLQLIAHTDLRANNGPLLAHAITLRRLPASQPRKVTGPARVSARSSAQWS